jgi:hypothetical protein
MKAVFLFLVALGVLFIADRMMPPIVRRLRRESRLPETRLTKDEAVPVRFLGNFERVLAFILVFAHVEAAYALLAAWLGAKLAASWQRLKPKDDGPEEDRQIRAGTLVALIAGIISVGFGIVAGLIARCAFAH